MIWSVTWLPDCEQELAAVWLRALDRDQITQSAHRIDQRLANDPDNEGESRPNGRRILFEAPLGVLYRVLPHQGLVQVLHIWQFE